MIELDWTAVGVIVTLGGILLSLLRSNRFFRAQMVGNLYGELHHVHQAFIMHPELRPIFFHNHEIADRDQVLDNKEYMLARGIAEMFLDLFEQIYILRPYAPRHLRPPLTGYIEHMCKSSSFLRRYLLDHEELIHPKKLLMLIRSTEKDAQQVSGTSA